MLLEATPESLRRKMEQAYFEHTGYTPDSGSDIGLRFRLLAAELYSLSLYGTFILKQAFPQTAQGEYLDQQAQARGIYRRDAAAATGQLTFSVDILSQETIEIPAGTVCTCKEAPYLRFVTVEKGMILPGAAGGRAPARAMGTGAAYNVAAGKIDVMVTPPAGVNRVTNPQPFQGGYDGEDDRMLRSRLLESIRFRPNGFDKASYTSRLLALDEVLDANAFKNGDDSMLTLALRTKNGAVSPVLRKQIVALLGECLLVPTDVLMIDAAEKPIPLQLVVMPTGGYNGAQAIALAKELIVQEYGSFRIGETFYPERLREQLSRLEGIQDAMFTNGTAPVPAGETEYLVLDPVEVTADAW